MMPWPAGTTIVRAFVLVHLLASLLRMMLISEDSRSRQVSLFPENQMDFNTKQSFHHHRDLQNRKKSVSSHRRYYRVNDPPSSWAQTEDGRVCSSILSGSSLAGISPSQTWNLLKKQILNASYFPVEHANILDFRDWVDAIFTFYSTERLRRSMAHPAPNKSIRTILGLIAERLQDPSHAEAIRILVMGGSVTQGTDCMNNVFWLPTLGPEQACAWPGRLENMLNQVFFRGERVFQVINYGRGATDSEVGGVLLENQLIPGNMIPHIVISSYSTNDSFNPDLNASFYNQQSFIQAAHNLRPCDEDLPLVILADDMHGLLEIPAALEQTGNIYKTSSWYNIMAVMYSNVARHNAVANYVNLTLPNPLFGSSFSHLHLGMGFHIGMAWTVLFNLIVAIQETCSDTDYDYLDPNTTANLNGSFPEPPTKYQGRVDKMNIVADEWREREVWKDEHCKQPPLPPTNLSAYTTNVCSYAWIVNKAGSIYEPQHITDAMQSVLKQHQGWETNVYNNGTVFQGPGYGTETPNSTFSLEVHNVAPETNSVTIFNMEGNGPSNVDAKLEVTVRVIKNNSSTNELSFQISAYQSVTKTFVAHKFQLPGGGAKAGDSIQVDARLVSGQSFKITGMAFCQ